MKNILFVIVACLSFLQSKAADPYEAWWKKANDLYTQKQFDSAVYYYEKLATLNPGNEVVYYNLGNAYYRINRIGPAVLNYEKALQLNPNYREAADNLAITQSRIANRIPTVPDIFFVSWWKGLTQPNTAATWAIICLTIFILTLVLLWLRRVKKRHVPVQLIGAMWSLWAVFLLFSFFSAHNKVDSGKAVVMQNDAPLLNALQGKTQSLVPEGTTVQLKEAKGSWIQVRLPDGRAGWMQIAVLSKI